MSDPQPATCKNCRHFCPAPGSDSGFCVVRRPVQYRRATERCNHYQQPGNSRTRVVSELSDDESLERLGDLISAGHQHSSLQH